MKRNSDKFYGVDFRILSFVCIAVNLNKTSSYTFGKINSRAEYGVASHASLSIWRFWGKGERWKRKRERAEREKLSPSPLGRPDTQATPTQTFLGLRDPAHSIAS